ncbi:MAG: hypothetical protein IT179_00430 [Acidobacteria bacterium]|nr:hypothetical protein [Acidobacteriota bacterium]
MQTIEARVTRRALAWAVGMTVALYAMLWATAGMPASGPAAQAAPVLALTAGQPGN